jgi:hypothetical protein
MANWERIAEQAQGPYQASDFRAAAYKLIAEQVVYATDRGSRVAYELITRHQAAYRDLLDQVGLQLHHNHFHSYVAAIPDVLVAPKMRLLETRVALVLRRLYDDRAHATELVDGEALVELEELERAFKDLLGRDLPDRGELRALIGDLKRYGIARIEDAPDGQPFQIVVRPGIVDVLGESALLQLAAHAPSRTVEDPHEAA